MQPYLLLLLMIGWLALAHMRPQSGLSAARLGLAWPVVFVLITVMIGFRFDVGADWAAYQIHVDDLKGEPLVAIVWYGDLAYQLLNWLGSNVGGGVYFVNLICGALFAWGLAAFSRSQPRPWLALLLAVPYLVMVVAMGYSRQGVAIGLVMLAITKLQNGSVGRFVFWIAVAALFHKSALILMPFAVSAASRYRFVKSIAVAISAGVMFVLLLQEQLDYFMYAYIEAEYGSSGALIRIAMNAIPAAIFLAFNKRFKIDPNIRGFWVWMAWFALLFVVILMLSPSTTAVDRVALYWIPLQIFVLSRLPDAFGSPGRRNPVWVASIVTYSATVMLGWLVFADMAHAWLPYRFYPWEALWS